MGISRTQNYGLSPEMHMRKPVHILANVLLGSALDLEILLRTHWNFPTARRRTRCTGDSSWRAIPEERLKVYLKIQLLATTHPS